MRPHDNRRGSSACGLSGTDAHRRKCYHYDENDIMWGGHMIRTQVQLSDSQMEQLKELAHRRGVPVAALIREGADIIIRSSGAVDAAQQRRRAMAAAGRFHSGGKDLAAAHDRHLAEAFGA